MFHSRKANAKINHIHERALRIVYKENNSSFEEFFRKDKSFCIHHRNNLSNRIMCDIFETRNFNYNLKSQTDFVRTRANTSSFGLNSLKY